MSNKKITRFSSFILLIQCITLIDFLMLSQPPTTGMNAVWSQCITLFYVAGSICWYLVEDFCMYIHKKFWSEFYCDSFVWLWHQDNTGPIEWARKFLSSSNFWMSLRGIGINLLICFVLFYWLNLITCYMYIKIFNFFLSQFW